MPIVMSAFRKLSYLEIFCAINIKVPFSVLVCNLHIFKCYVEQVLVTVEMKVGFPYVIIKFAALVANESSLFKITASTINNILAKIEANYAGADDAVMLDQHGYLSETNATNLFLVKDEVLYTPFANSCLPGFTRQAVMEIAEAQKVPFKKKDMTMAEMYIADEVFTTGTMGALSWVKTIDGRQIGDGRKGRMTQELQEWYGEKVKEEAVPIPH